MKARKVITFAFSSLLALFLVSVGFLQVIALPVNISGVALQTETKLSYPRLWLVTGGQTGVDRATLDTALSLFLPVRGWCPKGRLAEDGIIPYVYPLQETTSKEYAVRTEWNVRDSDATLILAYGPLEGGTKLTADLARKYNRPVLVLNALTFGKNDIEIFHKWIQENRIRILNVAGPRESSKPGVIYNRAQSTLKQLLHGDAT